MIEGNKHSVMSLDDILDVRREEVARIVKVMFAMEVDMGLPLPNGRNGTMAHGKTEFRSQL